VTALPRIAIFISGTGSNMEALIRAMRRGCWAVPALVVSDTARAPGLRRAQDLCVPTRVITQNPDIERVLSETAIDVICLAGFMRILAPSFVRPRAGRILNIHPSLLPKYPGLNTHARALDAGDSETGCTVHLVTEAVDKGFILGQRRVPIRNGDTSEILSERVLKEEHKLYPDVLRRFARGYGCATGPLSAA